MSICKHIIFTLIKPENISVLWFKYYVFNYKTRNLQVKKLINIDFYTFLVFIFLLFHVSSVYIEKNYRINNNKKNDYCKTNPNNRI